MKNITVVSVEISCCKCKKKVMKIAAGIPGVESIAVDVSKNTLTVIGEVDPVELAKKIRKFKKRANIISVGPPEKKKDGEKKNGGEKKVPENLPKSCPTCGVWYIYDAYAFDHNTCSIM
ncbi:hypothetical protein SUGI_0365510 [Cryptomeria japonica]|nr:hypothetical protein SUGI_0365510 [Cryptomeria japonica]